MPAANAPIYAPSLPASARTGVFRSRATIRFLDELTSHRTEFPRAFTVSVTPQAPPAPPITPHIPPASPLTATVRVWSPLGEPATTGLGPSVAELTLGRPPRAPRPGDR